MLPAVEAPTAPALVAGCPACRVAGTSHVCDVSTNACYAVERCRGCGLVYTMPRPTPEELADFYSSTYFERSAPTRLGYADYRAVAEANAKRMWLDLQRYTDLSAVTPQRLLDVGCATGGFLAAAAADGWSSVGIELSRDAAAIAREEYRLDVLEGDIESAPLEPAQFGLVTLWHVLEHLPDPLGALERVRKLLAPDGLAFIELPNWNSLGRVAKGAKWSQLKPPEHINFFTPKSLRLAAERSGLDVLRVSTHYPSLVDRAAVRRRTRPLHLLAGLIGTGACALDRGGYVRLLARAQR